GGGRERVGGCQALAVQGSPPALAPRQAGRSVTGGAQRCQGQPALAGSESSGRRANTGGGTREARPLAWEVVPGPPGAPGRETAVMAGGSASDRGIGPRPPAHNGGPTGPAEPGAGRARATGHGGQPPRGRTPRRGGRVPGARPRMAAPWGGRRVTPRGRSPVRECRTPGAGRGVLGNRPPYRDLQQQTRRSA